MSEGEATHARHARGMAELTQLIGAILVIVGLWLIAPPLALVAAGVAFLGIGIAVERGLANGPGRSPYADD